ncbi:unnamed protein product, partial [Mesorhabditis belari]|uniref:Uncharacterized protein n=1 Tax=Mesorhabditis belari TaxID=2138241 RepID=A0AAF3J4V9_9BILA
MKTQQNETNPGINTLINAFSSNEIDWKLVARCIASVIPIGCILGAFFGCLCRKCRRILFPANHVLKSPNEEENAFKKLYDKQCLKTAMEDEKKERREREARNFIHSKSTYGFNEVAASRDMQNANNYGCQQLRDCGTQMEDLPHFSIMDEVGNDFGSIASYHSCEEPSVSFTSC